MTSEDPEPVEPEGPHDGRQMGEDRVEFRNCRAELRGMAKDSSANERWELRQKALVACERALDVANTAEPVDLERLRLGLDAAQLLLQLQPPPWHAPSMFAAGHTVTTTHMPMEQVSGVNFIATGPPLGFHQGFDQAFPSSAPPPPPQTSWMTEGFPPPPTMEDLLAAGQIVTPEDLNLTSDEPSGWLLDGDEDGPRDLGRKHE